MCLAPCETQHPGALLIFYPFHSILPGRSHTHAAAPPYIPHCRAGRTSRPPRTPYCSTALLASLTAGLAKPHAAPPTPHPPPMHSVTPPRRLLPSMAYPLTLRPSSTRGARMRLGRHVVYRQRVPCFFA
eukprot:1157307-Pelagomonas_calceolata.AAC.5